MHLNTQELQAQSSELKVQTHQLEEHRNQVTEANRLKSEFLSNMSHELRTPLNSILVLSQLMVDHGTGTDPKKEAEYLRVIERNGRNLLSLINDILDLSKIESGRMDVMLEEFYIEPLVRDVIETTEPLAKEKGLMITCHAVPDVLINSDRDKIRQIILNLLSNSVKFTDSGKIELRCQPEEKSILIEVSDTGIGIPKNELKHIFDEFRQVDGTTTRRHEGTGLGLAICQKLSGLLGSVIEVTSQAGQGSTFRFRLPIRHQEITYQSIPKQQYVPTPTAPKEANKLILVVDDDERYRNILCSHLEKEGYSVETASNGRECIAMAQRLKPAAITLDVLMSEMDGWETIRTLKENHETSSIPIIMITVSNDKETAFALGANAFLVKPVEPDTLIKELERLSQRQTIHQILIVDDEKPVREIMSQALSKHGYRTETAANGHKAMSSIAANLPDLVILDLLMPKMDGSRF